MDAAIAQDIAKALDSRHFQRQPAAELLAAWESLTRNVNDLITVLDESQRQFSHDSRIKGAHAIAGELDRWRHDDGLLGLTGEIASQRDGVTAIRDRSLRTTVNIGVIGQTGSGKSTFLQQVTTLPADVIPPANGPRPTTAARSRFRHSRDRAEAEIKLLTWDEFRARYTAPLHAEAGCPGEAPRTAESFLAYDYKRRLATAPERQDSETVSPQALLERLIIAQESFGSYRNLLGTGKRRERLEDLRPYVAYPRQDEDMNRPYHAVLDVLVSHPFVVDIENLVFVDLPGTGETGLEVGHQFLADLASDIDVFLHILRPLAGRSRLGKADDEILDLADRVKMGRNRGDFICLVVNEDRRHNTREDATAVIENVWREAQVRAGSPNFFTLVRGNVSDQAEARDKILVPVLSHLALKLAEMDQAVARYAAEAAQRAARNTAAVVSRLAADVDKWQVDIPPEEEELARKSKDLRDQIARGLLDLSRQYGRRAQAKEPVPEVEDSLAEAKRRLADWASAEFGSVGRSDWVKDFENKMAGDPGEAKDDACTVVRQKLRYEFKQVDSSLDAARRRVHGQIAGILRERLGPTLVPEGDEPFGALLDATSGYGMGRLHTALVDLVEFSTGYGSIFLRVGRPVVAQITREHAEAPRPGAPAGPAPRPHPSAGPPSPRYRGTVGPSGALIATGQPHAALAAAAFAAALAAATKVGEKIGPMVAEWLWPTPVADTSAESFRRALSAAFDRAVDLIAEQIRNEASQLTEALAAIVDEFFDGFTHVPMIEYEYKVLCGPRQSELWPGAFGSGSAELSRGLGRLGKAAKDTATAARAAADVASAIGTVK